MTYRTFDGTSQTETITTGRYSSSFLSPQPHFKNRLINGTLEHWQRGATITTNASYSADRWKVQGNTANISVARATPSGGPNALYSAQIKATNNDITWLQFGQQIENINCWDLQGKKVTISFWAKALVDNDASKALTVRTRHHASADGAALFAGTNSDTSVTLTTTWTRYLVSRVLPTSFGAVSIEFVLGDLANNDVIEIAQMQVESGNFTSFEQRSNQLELHLCKRYYQLQGAGLAGMADDTSRWSVGSRFDPVMRAAPTATVTSATPQVRSRASDKTGSSSSIAYSAITANAFHVGIDGFTGMTQGDGIVERQGVNFLSFEAEL